MSESFFLSKEEINLPTRFKDIPWDLHKNQILFKQSIVDFYSCLTSQSTIFQSCGDNFSDFLGWTSTEQRIKCLAQRHNTVLLVSLELGTH